MRGLTEIVADNFTVYRRSRGMSRAQMAELLGVHRSYVWALEKAERNLTLTSLQRYAQRMDVDVFDLLTD